MTEEGGNDGKEGNGEIASELKLLAMTIKENPRNDNKRKSSQ